MKYINPVRIVDYKNVENKDSFLMKHPLQIELCGKTFATMKDGSFIILDFGKELSGGIRIFNCYSSPNNSLRIRFGESVGETCSEIGEKGSTNDHSTRDLNMFIPMMSDMKVGCTGFRFVRIDFKGEFLNIRNIVAACDNDTRKEYGYFISNDNLLNEIWNTGAYTLRLNLHNGLFWDGVKRDRLCWIGDSYPEMKASQCLYKNVKEIKNSLDFTAKMTAKGEWMNGIPTYNLWWLMILADNYLYDGDKAFVLSQREVVVDTIKKFDSCIDANGTVNLPMLFIDWPTHWLEGDPDLDKKEDEITSTYIMLDMAFKKVKKLFTDIKDDEILRLVNGILSRLSNQNREVLKFKQVAALSVLNGSKKSYEELLFNGGAKGLSTFQSYFVLSAMASYGRYEETLNILKEYYGGMLSVGSTTFWEDFDIEWLHNCSRIDEMPVKGKKDIHGDYGKFCYSGYRHSLCHGWSSAFIGYLVETVAGLKIIDSTHYSFKPHMSGLKNLKCGIPTPYGMIEIVNKVSNGKLLSKIINCPKEITIV